MFIVLGIYNFKKKWRGGTLTPPRALIACAAKNGLLGQRKIAGKGKKKNVRLQQNTQMS